ncbi:hypothetical protein ANO11243_041410 [Dothideomycetidae sp. 11243]|nr:hypothetical protein ANO11243_041410 [fungal sp. No.11243]
MKASQILRGNSTNYGTSFTGAGGQQPWAQLPDYKTYKSKYGPHGVMAAGFGTAAGIFAVFFFGEVPKVRKDILSKVPLIGDHFIREVPPEDNPF